MSSKVNIKYIGQCGFIISSEGLRIVTDPHLSYRLENTHYCAETPWKRLYAPPCTLSEIDPDYIIISHAHDDHLDPDTVKEYILSGKKAFFIAPAPICCILEELGVDPDKIIPARDKRASAFKDCEIIPIACAHTEFHTDGNRDFFELSYIIKIGGKSIFFGGDMSLYEDLSERISLEKPDLLLLPCNGRDEERSSKGIIGNITEVEAASLASELGVPFVPMHHDLYAINGCPEEKIIAAARAAGAKIITDKDFSI